MKRKNKPSTIVMDVDGVPALVTYYYSCSRGTWTEDNGDPGEPEHEELDIVSVCYEDSGKPMEDVDAFLMQNIEEHIIEHEREYND